MAGLGYGSLADRAFVAFGNELEDGAWKDIVTKKYEGDAKESAAALLAAPQPVVWKLRLRFGIGSIVQALGVPTIASLDAEWDSAQRRLFHRIGAGAEAKDPAVRAAAARLAERLLSGSGTGQTQLDSDGEVDFGRNQIAITQSGPLAADVKKLKIEDALEDIKKATEDLAAGVGRSAGQKRKAPSKALREAVAECAGSFNAVHEQIGWFLNRTPKGTERDTLTALLAPLEALLARGTPAPSAQAGPVDPGAPPADPAGAEGQQAPSAAAAKKPA